MINAIDYIKVSQNFLYAVKVGDATTTYIDTLKQANPEILASQLNTDPKRLVFWLNIYNGYTQVLLKNNPDQYKTRNSFFSNRQIPIAGQHLSLDDIEHGILRHSKIKWSEGYLNKLFPSSFEKTFRIQKLDYRIHFALNCGAKSCPAIAFYDVENINEQLALATKVYLEGECDFNSLKNVVHVPAIMGWFRNDFGGKKQMVAILKQNEIIPKNSYPKIHFKKYDWTLYLDNYKSVHIQ
ncbi:DUF547 domain-containing protein [Pedobacter changchengzhani]|nr:DUF547 domain-containing protein [Pedobacter changchengzhani]